MHLLSTLPHSNANRFISIYIHWPFCLSKCPYCDFNSHVSKEVDHNKWLESYEREIDHFANIISGKYIKSIFFGGGTPSLMQPYVVEGVLKRIACYGNIDINTEITLEANPTSFEIAKFKEFNSAGINRVSIGVQSLRENSLKDLGREHDSINAIDAITNATKIFKNVSFDLIYARPNQTLNEWQIELKEAMDLASGHISLYQLTIEKGTPFYSHHKSGSLILPKESLAADMLEMTDAFCESKGYINYEISNYAQPGKECVHNLIYWNYGTYLGIGPGAHSRVHKNNKTRALMMTHKPSNWLEQVLIRGHGIQSDLILSSNEIASEFIMMALRLKNGINLNSSPIKIDEFIDFENLKKYQEMELLTYHDDFLKLTKRGLMLHSYIVPRLLK